MALEGHLWEKPASPHALDDEFEDTVLDPAWDLTISHDYVSGLDSYDFPSPARVSIHTDHRRSWLMTQGNTGWFTKSYTLPTNCLIWARMRFDRRVTKIAGDQRCGILFASTNGGVVNFQNSLRLWLSEFQSGEPVMFDRYQSGVFAEIAQTNDSLSTRVKCIEYVMIHKVGSTFHAWCMGQSGEKIYIGSTAFAGDEPLDRVGFYMESAATASSPGYPSMGIDFLRIVESATYLP